MKFIGKLFLRRVLSGVCLNEMNRMRYTFLQYLVHFQIPTIESRPTCYAACISQLFGCVTLLLIQKLSQVVSQGRHAYVCVERDEYSFFPSSLMSLFSLCPRNIIIMPFLTE